MQQHPDQIKTKRSLILRLLKNSDLDDKAIARMVLCAPSYVRTLRHDPDRAAATRYYWRVVRPRKLQQEART